MSQERKLRIREAEQHRTTISKNILSGIIRNSPNWKNPKCSTVEEIHKSGWTKILYGNGSE